MKFNIRSLSRLAIVSATVLVPSLAYSAGFEKATTWSGHYTAIGGAASSNVTGAESLYFNPAGLASGAGIEVSGNFSPTFGKFNGPFNQYTPGPAPFAPSSQLSIDSNRSFSPVFGALASYKVNDRWGFGIGTYVSGGTKAIYQGVNFGNLGGNAATATVADVKADLSLVEFSIGTGYEVIDGLRIGVAYRILRVGASLASVSQSPLNGALSSILIDNLSAMRYNGFKLGVQYAPKESRWGIGADWRTEVGFSANSDSVSGTVTSPGGGGQQAITGTSAQVNNIFPQQIEVGGHWEFMDKQRVFAQYTFTEYHRDGSLDISGSIQLPVSPFLGASSGQTPAIPSIPQNWQNMNQLRLGYECASTETWAFRAGYIFTSQVTATTDARPTFAAPGSGHTFVLGVGKTLLDKTLELDGAVEYSFDSGSVASGDLANGGSALVGSYSANAYAAHLGATYRL